MSKIVIVVSKSTETVRVTCFNCRFDSIFELPSHFCFAQSTKTLTRTYRIQFSGKLQDLTIVRHITALLEIQQYRPPHSFTTSKSSLIPYLWSQSLTAVWSHEHLRHRTWQAQLISPVDLVWKGGFRSLSSPFEKTVWSKTMMNVPSINNNPISCQPFTQIMLLQEERWQY